MILITGATGFVGGQMLQIFTQKYGNDQVVGTGRNSKIITQFAQKNIKILQGDLTDNEFIQAIFEQYPIKTIIHTAAKSSPWGSYESFFRDNVQATQNLLNSAKNNGVQRFVHISTPSIYFNFSDRYDVKEADPIDYTFVNHYTATKHQAEVLVQQTAQETDIFTVILRPRAIIGVGDTVIIPRVLKAYHARKLKMVGKGKTIADFTSVANLCHAAVLATNTQNPQCNGEIFNITDGEPQNLWDFIAFFLTQMHLNPTLKKVPYPLVYALAWCNQNFNAIFTPNTEPALTCYGVGILRYSLTMNIQKAVKLLDYQPITTSRQSIVKFVATQKNY